MKRNTTLYHQTMKPDLSVENWLRAERLLSYLLEKETEVLYKDVRSDMGLSYAQTVRAVDILQEFGLVVVTTKSVWNGQHYIYPHSICIIPPSL